ncbi:MAG: alpha/beta hydrolase [Actinobacteria bacterium]|nr:alpha/beta hydrolase [Actinomycetota bacterium]MBW3649695.1 alpha/beta hydrolase [Actinomycetota bacterium]
MPQAVASDGTVVAYYDLGGTGPPLLLAHATGFHGRVWAPLVAELSGRFRCFAFDQRGHGDTPAPADGDFGWHGFARDALAVVDAAGLRSPFGLGHSAGATALLLAELDRPGTFRALYCYEPVVAPPPSGEIPPPVAAAPPGLLLAAGARRRREVFASRPAAYEHYGAKPPLSVLAPAVLRAYVDHGFEDLPDGTVRLKCRSENEARSYEMGMSHGAWDRLAEITCATTVACGGLSDSFGPAVAAEQAARLPHGRIEVFDGLGHFGPLQDPAVVAAAAARTLLGPAPAHAPPGPSGP